MRFRGRPLWKTAPKRKQSPFIRWAFVKRVLPPLVFGSSLISEHEVSDPRPRPTERYSGSTEGNGPPPPLNRFFSSPRSCRAMRTPCLVSPHWLRAGRPRAQRPWRPLAYRTGDGIRHRSGASGRGCWAGCGGQRPPCSGRSHPASTRKPDEPFFLSYLRRSCLCVPASPRET